MCCVATPVNSRQPQFRFGLDNFPEKIWSEGVWGLDWGKWQTMRKEVSKFFVIDKGLYLFNTVCKTQMTRHTSSFSHTRVFTGGDTHKPCNWILCRKQTFSCKHIICHLYSLIHILYAKWRNTRAHTHTHPCSLSNKQMRPCESHHHDHPSFIITLGCSITQQHDLAWNQLAGPASTMKCTLPNPCFGLMENNV